MKIVAVIPARYESSRFPGKPLADICGKPMIWWVYQNCCKVELLSEVYVATDSEHILKECQRLDMKVVMTSRDCLTGTDRCAEAVKGMEADIFVNVQGDEPLLEPATIAKAVEPLIENEKLQVTNLMTKINDPVDLVNDTVPKVITTESGIGLYLTRASAPYPKGKLAVPYYKQVCVYGFRPEALAFFGKFGKEKGKARIEEIEDIEVLRFIENGYQVQYVEVESGTVAVDTPKDLERVCAIMRRCPRGGDKWLLADNLPTVLGTRDGRWAA